MDGNTVRFVIDLNERMTEVWGGGCLANEAWQSFVEVFFICLVCHR